MLEQLGLNEREKIAIRYVKERGSITNKEYQEITGVSKVTAFRDLCKLTEKAILEKSGVTGKRTIYKLKMGS